MPQMKPMLWLIMLMLSIMIFFISMSKLYYMDYKLKFYFIKNKNLYKYKNLYKKKYLHMNKKIKW